MIDTVLVGAKTVVNAKGDSPSADLSAATGRIFLMNIDITEIIEQESLEISIFGSADGAAWDPKAIFTLPQKFYRGQTPFILDLTPHPSVRFVRAHWEVARWGRGSETPMFEFGLTLREIPPEVLRGAATEAKSLV